MKSIEITSQEIRDCVEDRNIHPVEARKKVIKDKLLEAVQEAGRTNDIQTIALVLEDVIEQLL